MRIVGNGGTDGLLGTAADNFSYNIGFDSLNHPLSDGTSFDVPRGVTVMISPGTVIKLAGANINVGSVQETVSRAGGVLQVLGTPAKDSAGRDIGTVYLTSYYDSTIGTDPGTNKNSVSKGDWGGIVFRDDSDKEGTPGTASANQVGGVFLDYVNHARLSYGGGSVRQDGQLITFDPIHLVSARPTITFNTIINSQDAAMSANGNSFEDTEFLGAAYQADYTRVGPKVYGNTVTQNSLNALFIRVPTDSDSGTNNATEKLTVQARIANTDIVYVLTETLTLQGNAGGMLQPGSDLLGRTAARLIIDPGVIVKASAGRFETEIGANLIAEGTVDRPVIFTSWFDDRYGASGSSDTTNNSLDQLPAPGNWGGFLFGPLSSGSIDHALVAFAGGSVSFDGNFSSMEPVEINQAKVRIANSTFDYNLSANTTNRGGRGVADASTIFISGAQPVILNNVFKNGVGGPVISVNVNSLNSKLVDDWGGSRGPISYAGSYPTNHGPLIRNNLVGNNSANGMLVRGGLLTTNGIWDDTDIVHIVTSAIAIGNQQSLTGTLRLQSSSTESLVVKLLGTDTSLIAGGQLSDIADRTGGTLQIVGTPGHNVVLTSLKDDTVGAGLTPSGQPQNDTLNRKGVVDPVPPNLPTQGPVMLDTTPRDVHGSNWTDADGWDTLAFEVRYIMTNQQVADLPAETQNTILVIGYSKDPDPEAGPSEDLLDLGEPYSASAIKWAAANDGNSYNVKFIDEDGISLGGVRFEDYPMIYIPSSGGYTPLDFPSAFPGYPLPDSRTVTYDQTKWWGGVDDAMLKRLHDRQQDLLNYVNSKGGGLLVMAQDRAGGVGPYNFLVGGGMANFGLEKSGGNAETFTEQSPQAALEAANLWDDWLNIGTTYDTTFKGPSGFNRLQPWAVDPVTGEAIILGLAPGGPGIGPAQDIVRAGDWGTVRLDTLSNDRNVDIVNEVEQGFTSAGDTNSTSLTSQYIGQLAKDALSGDDNVRLGFQIQGAEPGRQQPRQGRRRRLQLPRDGRYHRLAGHRSNGFLAGHRGGTD